MNQKKIAIFVEGQTERMFVTKLLQEITGYKNISIEIWEAKGSRNNRNITLINSIVVEDTPFFALLYDCGSESHVVSDIKKQHKSLIKRNFEKIIGLRDLYPKPLTDKQGIEDGIKGFLKPLIKNGIPISVILAIIEVEAWFLAEAMFFSKIDNRLTTDFILQNCGIDLINLDVEQRPHPSEDLNNIYRLIGKTYDKNKEQVKDIVEHLDYKFIYLELVNTVKQLEKLIKEIDSFLV
jgi:hypothetical protein